MGIVGLAIGYELSKKYNHNVVLLDKNHKNTILNQPTHNSGVNHAGIYYDKENQPLKAKLCVEGNQLLYKFLKKHEIDFDKCGKLVVASHKYILKSLEDVFKTAKKNGVPDIDIITSKQTKKMEPNVKTISALYVPSSGIIDVASYLNKLNQLIQSNESNILPST